VGGVCILELLACFLITKRDSSTTKRTFRLELAAIPVSAPRATL